MVTVILNEQQINQKIKRIAFQILENNTHEDQIFIAGIADNGYIFAQKLKIELEINSKKKINLCKVNIDKEKPLDSISTSISIDLLADQSVVLVDDVLNSGKTLIYSVRHFLQVPLKKIKTAVLVNRNHKNYPVKSDFKGISLSTSIEEHVEVSFNNKTEAILY